MADCGRDSAPCFFRWTIYPRRPGDRPPPALPQVADYLGRRPGPRADPRLIRTVTMLTIWLAVCALTILAALPMPPARPPCERSRVRKIVAVPDE